MSTLAEEFTTAQERSGKNIEFHVYNAGTSLCFYQESRGVYQYCTYHFLTRTMNVTSGNHDGGVTVVPFAQLDREVLEFMRDKLIELGGHPPALPPVDSENKRNFIQKAPSA